VVADAVRRNDDRLSLPAVLSGVARRASDTRLAVYAGAGLLILVGAVVFRPAGWIVLSAFGACVGSFGAWAITGRELLELDSQAGRHRVAGTALRTGRVLAAMLGAAGAAVLLFLLLAAGLGTWRS
jgi:hypothetical protein